MQGRHFLLYPDRASYKSPMSQRQGLSVLALFLLFLEVRYYHQMQALAAPGIPQQNKTKSCIHLFHHLAIHKVFG